MSRLLQRVRRIVKRALQRTLTFADNRGVGAGREIRRFSKEKVDGVTRRPTAAPTSCGRLNFT